ncbi:MAG: hypothetical protein K2X39_04890, partial [Silvanigrellaceae bacterium]|nr:hypothetical protein [Silvanigrellaceae bacterium]
EFEIIKEILPALGGYYFLLKQGNKSVIARLNLSGLDNDARVLSGTLARAKLLDEIRVRTGDKPESWLAPYMRLSHILENDYNNSFPQLLPHFERHWEECR